MVERLGHPQHTRRVENVVQLDPARGRKLSRRYPDTISEVEGLVDDYTSRIDDTIAAEDEPVIDDYGDIETPEGKTSDELIDDARWEIEDAVSLGRSLAECED